MEACLNWLSLCGLSVWCGTVAESSASCLPWPPHTNISCQTPKTSKAYFIRCYKGEISTEAHLFYHYMDPTSITGVKQEIPNSVTIQVCSTLHSDIQLQVWSSLMLSMILISEFKFIFTFFFFFFSLEGIQSEAPG